MKSLTWIGSTMYALVGSVNPWLAVYGITVVLVIVIVVCRRDVKIAEITSHPPVKPSNDSKKHNKKNR